MRVMFLSALLFACSESDDTATDAGFTGTDAGRLDAGGGGNDAGGGTDAGAFDANFDAGEPPEPGELVVNEIAASGDDWIELYNAGATPIALDGIRVADRDDDTMMARIERAVAIPAGVSIPAGGYFFVLADQDMPSTTIETACLEAEITACIHTDWGISAADGDTIHLVAPDDSILHVSDYPGEPEVIAGQSWARIPDGSADFAAASPSPNTANTAL
jgi:hypothetical protein